MKRILLISILFIFVSLSIQAQKIEFKKVGTNKFHSLIEEDNNHLLIDVSRKIDRLKGHIPHAVFSETSEKLYHILDTTPSTRPILIYCKHGKRCMKASWLIAQKYPHRIFALKKGFENWKSKGYKVSN
jgi:rhodanese-related sulfurtransferase